MTKELIERYLQFAIDNWLDIHKWVSKREHFNLWIKDFYFIYNEYSIGLISKHTNSTLFNINTIELITSWPFIEAIARGVLSEVYWEEYKTLIKDNKKVFNELIEGITHQQADAIRDNKLDEFIQDLLPKN
jgi:hypothetical protein